MIFTDWTFFVFFGVVSLVHWFIPSNLWRKVWLLASRIVFYAAWDSAFSSASCFLVIFNTYAVTLLGPGQIESGAGLGRRGILAAGIVVSLGVLGFFKYFNFFVARSRSALGLHAAAPRSFFPVGLCFYTFQSISHTIDSYRRRRANPQSSSMPRSTCVFSAARRRPDRRATDLLPQFETARSFAAASTRGIS